MIIWIDAQLSPAIAKWINQEFDFRAIAIRDLGLRDADDAGIFEAARKESAVVMTKDAENTHLRKILKRTLPRAIDFLDSGEDLVEISDKIVK